MKNIVKLFGIIALVAVIGFSFAACGGNDSGGGGGGGGGGSYSGPLLGKWYFTQEFADKVASLEDFQDWPAYEFTSDGKFFGNSNGLGSLIYTATSNTFTIRYARNQIEFRTYNYSISGTVLKCKYSGGTEYNPPFLNGTWYKPGR